MNAFPFSIFKRADRSCYSVSYKDANGKYLRPVSTGKKTEKEAMDMAFIWLRDGIPHNVYCISIRRCFGLNLSEPSSIPGDRCNLQVNQATHFLS